MEKVELNLTRKWRSKNFQQLIGQSLVVRILQNSLYLNQFFPVYLFAGQRGCGKTSTARIFAAAVNCNLLADFQQDPRKISLPCLQCPSCIAMATGQHPDFIEIDAASHTGVDNVRNIIDASSFLPIMSSKKIYLIDEAHMLSKAAFNAFLKILEEPPMSVIFILATTDMHKILDTVKSRCFQLFFDPVPPQIIADHLEKICIAEQIFYHAQGLLVIAQEAGGSVRDAINILEQVRFATKKITKDSVISVLGHIDEQSLMRLFLILLQKNSQQLLQFSESLTSYEMAIEYVWAQLLELVYDAIVTYYGLTPRSYAILLQEHQKTIQASNIQDLAYLFSLLSSQEQHLAKTTKKLRFLEMNLLQYTQGFFQESKKKINDAEIVHMLEQHPLSFDTDTGLARWNRFITTLTEIKDLVVVTMFKEAEFKDFNRLNSIVSVSFLKKFSFFKENLDKEKSLWLALLIDQFGAEVQLESSFNLMSKTDGQSHIHQISPDVSLFHQSEQIHTVQNRSVDQNIITKSPLMEQLIKHFDGVIKELPRNKNE